jgi:phosphomevalonate kinase
MPIAASAPGKVILSGEYAVLDGAPAMCMAVDRRARVTVEHNDEDHHVVAAPGYTESKARFRVADGVVEWLAGGEDFKLVEDLWQTAHIETSRHFSIRLDTSAFVDVESGAKIGIGSSAALMTAFATALCRACDVEEDPGSIAFAAHRAFQKGLGSGVDIACCSRGGLIEYTMGKDTGNAVNWPDGLVFGLFWSGVSVSTSAKLEHLIRSDRQPSREALTYASRRVASAWGSGNAQEVLLEYRDYIRVLREFSDDHGLGIFDAGHAEMVAAAEAAGLVYKPCGAGGGDVGIVLSSDAESIAEFVDRAKELGFRHLAISADPLGVQVTG